MGSGTQVLLAERVSLPFASFDKSRVTEGWEDHFFLPLPLASLLFECIKQYGDETEKECYEDNNSSLCIFLSVGIVFPTAKRWIETHRSGIQRFMRGWGVFWVLPYVIPEFLQLHWEVARESLGTREVGVPFCQCNSLTPITERWSIHEKGSSSSSIVSVLWVSLCVN